MTKTKDSDPSFIWYVIRECSIFCVTALISQEAMVWPSDMGQSVVGGTWVDWEAIRFTLSILTSAFSPLSPLDPNSDMHMALSGGPLGYFYDFRSCSLKYFIFTSKCYPLTLFQAGGLGFPQDFYFVLTFICLVLKFSLLN